MDRLLAELLCMWTNPPACRSLDMHENRLDGLRFSSVSQLSPARHRAIEVLTGPSLAVHAGGTRGHLPLTPLTTTSLRSRPPRAPRSSASVSDTRSRAGASSQCGPRPRHHGLLYKEGERKRERDKQREKEKDTDTKREREDEPRVKNQLQHSARKAT
eukprot:scaffold340_cov256-Pinguiococcus_pyrenoidosus.AAC.18